MEWKKWTIFSVIGSVLSIVITVLSGFFSGLEIFYLGQGTPKGWPLAFRMSCTAEQICPGVDGAGVLMPWNNIIFWIDAILWFLLLYVVWSMFGGVAEEKPGEGI